ncbi:MAG: hypothetical protein IJN51_02265 [Alistipes sp.]|nr:hypothetical protein [Alistipes sp.]
MNRAFYIVLLAAATMLVACSGGGAFSGGSADKRVIATVDDKELMLGEILENMPLNYSGADSTTFVRMYTDNWVLDQLKLARADEVLSSHEDIDRLVEGYRQSLIMRQLDQYYVDKELDTEVTERQIMSHYRTNSSQFVLDHDKVRGVIVRVSEDFRNRTALSDAMRSISVDDMQELTAFAEKHSLQVTDLTAEWVTFSDFLSYLPTVRTRSYNNFLNKNKVQSMRADDVVFYFVIVDVVREGELIPLECVEEDIRRMLYAERSAEIIRRYEKELKYEAIESGRVEVDDASLLDAMSHRPNINSKDVVLGEAQDVAQEEDVDSKKRKREEEQTKENGDESTTKKSDKEGNKGADDREEEKKVDKKAENKTADDKRSENTKSEQESEKPANGEDNSSKESAAKGDDDTKSEQKPVKPQSEDSTADGAEVTAEPKSEPKAEVKAETTPVETKSEPSSESKAEAKSEAKTEVKSEAKSEVKTETKAEAKSEAATTEQSKE